MQAAKTKTHPMFQPGYNIVQRVQSDNKVAEFADYAQRMQAIGRTTEWHESHQKYEVLRRNQQIEKKIQGELKHANAELKNLRQERLKQLYTSEAQMHEEELNKMGFAIFKDRL